MPNGPVRPALLASGGTGSFALALGALGALVPPRAAPAAQGEGDALLPSRQMLAEAGKDLPEPIPDKDDVEEQDKPHEGADIAFAWFATEPMSALAPSASGFVHAATDVMTKAETPRAEIAVIPKPLLAPPGETSAQVTIPAASDAPEVVVEHAMPALPTPSPIRRAEPVHASAVPIADAPDSIAPKAAASETIVAAPTATFDLREQPGRQAETPAPRAEMAIRQSAKASEQTRAFPPVQPSVAAALPLTRFNPAIVALAANVPAAPAPLRRALAVDSVALAILPSAPDAGQPHAVSAAADVQQSALDTRRQEWMGKMVEQIEALRDPAPVRETRLSLAPEALGKVDVSIRHDGDRVHVHFATETPAARQLIADAQPRLSELAEARGLKLGQTSFESGTDRKSVV